MQPALRVFLSIHLSSPFFCGSNRHHRILNRYRAGCTRPTILAAMRLSILSICGRPSAHRCVRPMNKRALILFSVVELLLIAVQTLIVWAWMRTEVIQQFMGEFESFYPTVPKWSLMVFGTKSYCWIFPLMCALLYLLVMIYWRRFFILLVVNLISMLVVVGMIYAMYPVGQMPSMGIHASLPNLTVGRESPMMDSVLFTVVAAIPSHQRYTVQ